MKTVVKIFKLYEFDELDKDSQNRVIIDWINVATETMNENSLFYDCAIKMEEMKTPWFLAECLYVEHKEDIIGIINTHECLFLKNGDTFDMIESLGE